MKNQTAKMLFALMLPVSWLFSLSNANGQIVYTDVIPDSTMFCVDFPPCTKDYNLDLDNDMNNDFILTAYCYNPPKKGEDTYSSVTVSPLNGNAVKDTLVNSVNVSIPLQFNAVIDSNMLLKQSWQKSGSHSLKIEINGDFSDTVYGIWGSLADYYLGLRLLQSGQTYYGWVRLSVEVTLAHASLIVKDYAYNSIPDAPILAGQIITGIAENISSSSIALYPNPASKHFTIALGSNNKKVDVAITDMTGKIFYSTTLNDAQKLEVNTEDFVEGIYVVKIQTADFIVAKKLVVEK